MRALAFKFGVNTKQQQAAKPWQRASVLFMALVVMAAGLTQLAQAAPGDYQWQKASMNLVGDISGWTSVASSADGTKLVAGAYSGNLYISTDSGATWTERTAAGSRDWFSVASSADGTKLVAGTYNGYLYTSTDSGATWTEQITAGSHVWSSVASSSDGSKLVAVSWGGFIYTSSDSGATWTERAAAGSIGGSAIASSADGAKLVLVQGGFQRGNSGGGLGANSIYTSTDSGATWTKRTTAGSRDWYSVASSSDGSKLVAVARGGFIYTSTDSGTTWMERTAAGSRDWSTVTASADGTKLVAGVFDGFLYTSTDSGATWTERTAAGSRNWSSVASSADGTKLVAALNFGSIYTSTDSGTTWMERTAAGSRDWSTVTASADGTKLVAASGFGSIYTSIDSGLTWVERSAPESTYVGSIAISADGSKVIIGGNGSLYISTNFAATWSAITTLNSAGGWYGLAMTPDGSTIVAVDSYGTDGGAGYAYISRDGGLTWQEQTDLGFRYWDDWNGASATISADGQTIAIADPYGSDWNDWNGGYIYVTHDGGSTWQEQTSLGGKEWTSIKLSADGNRLAAAAWSGSLYTSTDSGATWTEQTAAGSRNWRSIASSSDGSKLVAGVGGGFLYTSTDSGATWTEQTTAGSRNWQPVASSADGSKLAASAYGGSIYLATLEGPATATIAMPSLPTGNKDATAAPAVATASLAATSMACYTLTPGSVSTLGPDSLVVPESDVSLLGGVAFSLDCTGNGGTADTAITLGAAYTDVSTLRVYKRSGTGPLVDITKQVTIQNESGKTVVRYTLTDGSTWDEDGTANGTIVDPIYFGVVAGVTATAPTTPTTPAIPTIVVTPATVTVASSSLASTGTNVWMVAIGGVLLVICGAVIYLLRTHRSSVCKA